MNRDANTMSVMKAALPDDDNLLADALDALRRAPLAPDAVQLPTSFELLGGGPSPRTSPRLEARGMAAAAGGNGGGGGLAEAAGALPHQPGELTRSPSLEALLSKVQRIGVDQVTVLAKIGEGAFGEVSLAQCDTYGRVAVKWIKPTKVGAQPSLLLRILSLAAGVLHCWIESCSWQAPTDWAVLLLAAGSLARSCQQCLEWLLLLLLLSSNEALRRHALPCTLLATPSAAAGAAGGASLVVLLA
jgi:hypothetical protein